MSFLHNLSYRLSRNQAMTPNILALGFIGLSIVWFVLELMWVKFPMEPVVAVFGGLATLFASYWPWKPKYASRRLSGRVTTDYSSNDKVYPIGSGEEGFTIKWSSGSGSSIHLYNHLQDIDGVAIAYDVGRFVDIKDSSVFDFSSRTVTRNEGEIAVLRNTSGRYALVHIHDIRARSHGDDRDEITFSYVINPNKGTDFS
jgi:hypothetical protein